jgi:hypothetical protein
MLASEPLNDWATQGVAANAHRPATPANTPSGREEIEEEDTLDTARRVP